MPRKIFLPSAPAGGHSKVNAIWNCGCNDTKFSLGIFNSRSKLKLTRLKGLYLVPTVKENYTKI